MRDVGKGFMGKWMKKGEMWKKVSKGNKDGMRDVGEGFMGKWIWDEVCERVSWQNEYELRCGRGFHGEMDIG